MKNDIQFLPGRVRINDFVCISAEKLSIAWRICCAEGHPVKDEEIPADITTSPSFFRDFMEGVVAADTCRQTSKK